MLPPLLLSINKATLYYFVIIFTGCFTICAKKYNNIDKGEIKTVLPKIVYL